MSTDSIGELLKYLESRLQGMRDSLAHNPPIEHVVEVGTALWVVMQSVEGLREQIKATLRQEGVRRLQNQPGVVTLEGSGEGVVTVTVPSSLLRLAKDADIAALKKVLGDEFDLFFETETKHKPRKVVPDLVAQMSDGPRKMSLLSSLEEAEGTPRVSFKRK
jgi:hypothetical protein